MASPPPDLDFNIPPRQPVLSMNHPNDDPSDNLNQIEASRFGRRQKAGLLIKNI
jgi:hypothetical protein